MRYTTIGFSNRTSLILSHLGIIKLNGGSNIAAGLLVYDLDKNIAGPTLNNNGE